MSIGTPRSRQELFDQVVRRGGQLRRRRRRLQALVGAGAAVLMVALAVLAATTSGQKVTAADVSARAETSTAPREDQTSAADVAGPPAATIGTKSDEVNAQRHRRSVAPPSQLPTPATTPPPVLVQPTPTTSSTTTSTTVPESQAPDCTADVDQTTTTDRPAYAVGDPVVMTVTVRNHSDHSCRVFKTGDAICAGWSIRVDDLAGNEVWPYGRGAPRPAYPCRAPEPSDYETLSLGGADTRSMTWDQRAWSCAGSRCGYTQVEPGSYIADAKWVGTSTSQFQIT
jgi:hypothetical protein